jgi:Ca-activated chloride channel homolog
MFRFAQPEWLWLLALLALWFFLKGRRGPRAGISFPSIALAKQVAGLVRSRPGRFGGTLRALILACLILALARPQSGSETTETRASGIDIVLALDLSGSMWAHDFELEGEPVDRLSVVRQVVGEFIQKRPNDRIGLVAFATEPFLVSPLTLNHSWLQQNVERLHIGLIDENRTAIGTALGTSVNRLRAQKARSRIVILLTDGDNNAGDVNPISAAEAAEAFGIKVYTIGVAREGRVFMPYINRQTGNLMRDASGRMRGEYRESDLDMETLERIAEITGARAFRAEDTDELREIYKEIDRLEKTEIRLNQRAEWEDHFTLPLFAALGLLILEQARQLLLNRRLP